MSLHRQILTKVLIAVSFCSSMAFAAGDLVPEIPDPEMTPGVLCDRQDPDFIEYRYDEEIPYCVRNVSVYLKTEIYEAYGVPPENRRNYTIDHFIPLSIGGDNSVENLWPEHKEIKALRMNLEMEVYRDLEEGTITQDQAVRKIRREKLNPPLKMQGEYIQYKLAQ